MQRFSLFSLAVVATTAPLLAQSTLSSMTGTVQDKTGAVIPNAVVRLHRSESGTERTIVTDANGAFTALNLESGHYDVHVEAKGLTSVQATGIVLQARQQLRYDVTMKAGSVDQTVTVDANAAGVVNAENAQVSSVLTPEAVVDLPANYRGAGSTSPLSVVQALPGVQPDTGASPPAPSTHPAPTVRYSIQGGLPSQTETTVDGISAQNQTSNNVQADAFPSAESIAEIRVDGVSNNAEYGQPGEITTVTKSGSNQVHGSAYLYLQNDALNATPWGTDAADKPQVNAKDFGASIGFPLVLPRLYNGHDRTFLFGAYEGLRFPQTTVLRATVPTVLMKQGNFSQEDPATQLQNPFNGSVYRGNIVPINPVSAKFLQFYPDPNVAVGLSTSAAAASPGYNYLGTRRDDIDSDQFDVRIDHTFGAKASASARYTWKDNNQTQPTDLALPNSTAYAQYRILASNFTFAFTPRLANEFKFGFTLERDGNSNPFDGQAFTQGTGLPIAVAPFFNGIPHLNFSNGSPIYNIGERLGFEERSSVFQYIDNLTYTRGTHTLRVGVDIRHLGAFTEAGGETPSINYGNYYFDQDNSATGDQFADFLLGVPYQSQSNSIRQDNNGTANSYAFYAEDSWKATDRLNVNFGIRYEFHPALVAGGGLSGNFDPTGARTGRLIYPAGFASTLDVQELANVNACPVSGVNNPYATGGSVNGVPCTPVVSNQEAGLPAGLRNAPHLRFMPRFGFAYRPFGGDKTVIRGGAGYFNITTTGALFYAVAQTLQDNYQVITNSYSSAGPGFTFPGQPNATFVPSVGQTSFYSAIDTNWHDPYSLQQDLSIDHDFGHNFGGRISYVGMHTWHLVWQPNFNQLPTSATRTSSSASQTDYPFPNFYQIVRRNTAAQADYQSLQAEFSHRMSKGFSLDVVYTLAKNLADNQGTNGNYSSTSSGGFVDEQGGYNPTDSTNQRLDYGNVAATRRHRFLATAIYELPIGRGRQVGGNMNRALDALVGGWQVSNILVLQSGTFLTAYFPAGAIDPSGTGSGTYRGGANQRPDRIGNPNSGPHRRDQWFNANALACPNPSESLATCDVGIGSNPIGRFGTESVGDLHGPGVINLSSGLSKSFPIHERLHARVEGSFTNIANHTNLADPNVTLNSGSFGVITSARGSDFGGNRTGQVSVRVEF